MSLQSADALTGSGFTKTDENGSFHFAGVPPGIYRLLVLIEFTGLQRGVGVTSLTLSALQSSRPFPVYAPGTMHAKEAKAIEIKGSETVEQTLEVNLAELHTLRGHVTSAESRRGVNAGSVLVRDTADDTFSRYIVIQPDGSWETPYLPVGRYTVTVDARDVTLPGAVAYGQKQETLQRYEEATAEFSVTAGDVSDADVAVTSSKAKRALN